MRYYVWKVFVILMETLPHDCLAEISKQINTGSSWKSWVITNKCHNKVSLQFPNKGIELANKIRTLLKLLPTESWNWQGLSCNPSITWEIVQNNPKKPWDWNWLSRNPAITCEIV